MIYSFQIFQISGLTDRITQSGHQYALRRARSHIGPIGEINEQLSGFRQANTLAEYHSGNTEVDYFKLRSHDRFMFYNLFSRNTLSGSFVINIEYMLQHQ